MTLRERLWSAGVAALRPLLPAASLLGAKAARSAAGRRNAGPALYAWGREARDPGRRLLWLHGPSAGELLGAAPVIERLRRRRDLQLLVTCTSPSAGPALSELEPDRADYLPLDTFRTCRRVIGAVRPDALLFAKTDLWPALTRAAEDAGVPIGLVNGTVSADSGRLRWPARALLRPSYRRVRAAGAATARDADRLRELGVRPGAVRVTGDAAVDRALDRAEPAAGDGPLRRLEELLPAGAGEPRLLAGSTWPEDHELLLSAAAALESEGGPGVRLVLVPHEPDREAVDALRLRCRERLGRRPRLWSEASGSGRGPLVVDAVGPLARLYAGADLAYVGGGLGDGGLHSVVEPAAAGVPVLFGPRHGRWEAEALLARSAAAEVAPGSVLGLLRALLRDADRRRRMGRAAREFAWGAAGGAEAGAELADELISRGGS